MTAPIGQPPLFQVTLSYGSWHRKAWAPWKNSHLDDAARFFLMDLLVLLVELDSRANEL